MVLDRSLDVKGMAMCASERPIFIVGVHRSGTTLLRYMLSSSPRIYIPPESDFIPRFFGRNPHGRLTRERVAHLLDVIFDQYRFVRSWKGDPPDPAAFFHAMQTPTPAGFLEALYSTYARQYDAVRWGDKTPIYTSYLDLIHRILPQAQFIHLIRDGRDVALSTLDKWEKEEFHIDIYYAARNWTRRIRQARAAGSRLGPGHYHEVRYERLVRDPEPVLRRVCDFLGEPYVPAMSESHRLGRKDVPAGHFHEAVRRPPNPDRVARWQREMSPEDLHLFERAAAPVLKELGYPLAGPGRMSPRQLARLAALATKYEVLQAGRRILQGLGLLPPI
jgi:hypothetical protein